MARCTPARSEAEWENAARLSESRGGLLDDGHLAPRPAGSGRLAQMIGEVWEWTASPYVGYPGFQAATGAVGEYNGKFMINQMILRGRLMPDARRPYPAQLP